MINIRKRLKETVRTLSRFSGDLIGFPRLTFYCPVCEKKVYRWLPFCRDTGHGRKQLEPGGRS
jgi:hypothetical protein